MIDQIIDFNKTFVAQKGYEKYVTDWLEGFRDTETSVRKTVKTIKNHPLIPRDVTVRGFIIDSVTGALEEINSKWRSDMSKL